MNIKLSTARWLLILLILGITPYLFKMPLWLIIALSAVIIWRWFQTTEPFRPPHIIIRIIATALGIASVVLAHGAFLGRRAATTLLTVMLVLKLLELARLRDARLAVMSIFFLTATQFLFTQDLLYLPWMIACLIGGLAVLRLLHEDGLMLPAATAPQAFNERTGTLFRLASRILFLSIPLSLMLFMLFPRLSTPLWGVPEYALDGKSGLSDSMTPGRIQQMFLDDSPAFRAHFDGIRPPQHELYWRGPVLWYFDGRTWTRGNFQHAQRQRIPSVREAQWWYEIQLEPHERHWLFALDHPAQLPADTFLTSDYQLISRQPVTNLTRYQVATVPNFSDHPDQLPLYDRQRALQLPPIHNPRTQRLMEEWRQRFPDDAGFISHALNWFNQEPFFYSLEAPPLGANGVDEFLFDLRVGYCEYFASAFVVMMRAAGIPARVVTGYQGGTYNQVGDYLLVRQSDAHAWAEVWLVDQGWQRVDPTAMVSPERVQYGASAALNFDRGWQSWGWVLNIQTSLDALRNLWNHWVLSFDARRQSQLLSSFNLGELKHQHLILMLMVAIGILGFTIHWYLQRRRQATFDEAQRHYRRALRRLCRCGIKKNPAEGPQEFAHRIRPLLGPEADAWQQLTDDYYQLRYADERRFLASLIERVNRFKPKAKALASG